MKNYFAKFIGIRKKLIIYFLVPIFLLGSVSMISYFTAVFLKSNTQDIIVDYVYLNNLKNDVTQLNMELEKYLISASSEDLLDYYSHYNSLNNLAAKIPRKLSYNRDEMLLKDIGFMLEDLLAETDKAVISKRGRVSSQYTEHFARSNEIRAYIDSYIVEMLNNRLEEGSKRYDVLNQTMRFLFILNLGLIISVIVVTLIVAIRSSYKLTQPLTDLSHNAEEIAKGNFYIEMEKTHTGDEIDILSEAFIKMMDSVKGHIVDIKNQAEVENRLRDQEVQNFKMKALLKESELKFLQSQINPHFLFNTLNAASQLAVIEDAETTSLFIQNIADIFRYNLKSLDELVPLSDELEFVSNYMSILKMRFGERIAYEYNIDKDSLGIKIPRITLQPIIENAYIHGLQNLERNGTIRLETKVENEVLLISIEDDGMGLTKEQVDNLINEDNTEETAIENSNKHLSGIGVSNVIKRLKLSFQVEENQKIIDIVSTPDKGTKVILSLPLNNRL